MFKLENNSITVSITYDHEKVITGTLVNGVIATFEEPITGAYCVEARPKEDGAFIDGIGLYSVCFVLTEDDAFNRAIKFLKKTA